MKNKKWLLLLIIIFPSLFWLILETSTINSRKLPVYGKKELSTNGDTLFQKVNTAFYKPSSHDSVVANLYTLPSDTFGVFVMIFLNEKYLTEGFRIAGLTEFLNYKKSKIEPIPLVMITPILSYKYNIQSELKQLTENKNVHFMCWQNSSYDSITKSYFIDKPYYIDYSFLILVDANQNIRGYYDGRYASEIKRLIGEYQHLRLKEEKRKILETNEIKSNS